MFCVNRRTGRNAPVGKGPDPAVHLVAPSARRHASEGLRTSMSSWCVGLSYFTSVPHISANTDIFLHLAALPLTLIFELSTTVDFFPDGVPKCPEEMVHTAVLLGTAGWSSVGGRGRRAARVSPASSPSLRLPLSALPRLCKLRP